MNIPRNVPAPAVNAPAAANFCPSELDAIDCQYAAPDAGNPFVRSVQDPAPELAFVHSPAFVDTAANLIPSELDAIHVQPA